MSPSLQLDVTLPSGFPRVSGDVPETVKTEALVGEFSPRERG